MTDAFVKAPYGNNNSCDAGRITSSDVVTRTLNISSLLCKSRGATFVISVSVPSFSVMYVSELFLCTVSILCSILTCCFNVPLLLVLFPLGINSFYLHYVGNGNNVAANGLMGPQQQSPPHHHHQQQQQQPQLHKGSNGGGIVAATNNVRPQLRVRTSSFSSTGSSPPSSAETPPLTPGSLVKKSKFDFFAGPEQAAAGNIFKRRTDFASFSILPRHQQNPYHIKMEDEGPHGNDETRCFVLSNLSTHQVTHVRCVCCALEMTVYDRYPLIDGSFFLSPQRYNSYLQVLSDHKLLYLNAICMRCLEGSRSDLRCIACRKRWDGSALILGTMYSYDIFAAVPCCAFRTACKNCRRPIIDPGTTFNFYSEYSRPIQCPHCRAQDYHFVKPIDETFQLKTSSIRSF